MASGSSGFSALPASVREALQTVQAELVQAVREERHQVLTRLEAEEEKRTQLVVQAVSRILEGAADALEAKRYYEEHAEAFRRYAGVQDFRDLPRKVPASPEALGEVRAAVREKVAAWEQANPGLAPLSRALYQRIVYRLLRELKIPALSRLPADRVDLAKRIVASLAVEDMLESGPLAAAFAGRRAQLRLTQKAAARRCGVAEDTFGAWERGDDVPSRQNAPAAAAFLGLSRKKLQNLIEDQRRFAGARRAAGAAGSRHEGRAAAASGAEARAACACAAG